MSYLITNGEYPKILANGGKLLEMKIKTRNAKLIDSCCFIAMPLSRLVTLSIYLTLKGRSCDDCLPVHTFSGLGGKNALENFCKRAFDHPVNEGAVFIAHNSSTYDAHFILSYLITNGEYPEILANGGKLLEMKIKTRNAKLIDSCCFIAMPLSRFSDTFNIPHTKGTFPHMFNVSDNYNYVGPLPAPRYYDPNG